MDGQTDERTDKQTDVGQTKNDHYFLHIRLGFLPQVTMVLAYLTSHTLIRPMGKIKIENFHVFDIHWLYRT